MNTQTKKHETKTRPLLKLRKARKLKTGEALQELVKKSRVLPACESSCACSGSVR